MNIKVVAKDITVNDQMRAYLEKRVAKFDKLLGGIDDVYVTIKSNKLTQRVEITIPLHDVILRGEHECADVLTCIDEIVEKLESQVRKHKTKLARRMKDGSANRRVIDAIVEEPNSYELVRTKTYSQKPCSVEEAMMQMDLLGHDFFVFVNEADMQVSVIYRRNQGNYGLLVPEQ